MLKTKQIGQRAVKSVVALISRTFFLNAINFAGTLALTIYLTREEFGVFIIASSVIEILTYFSDIGLAGALIQKPGKLSKKEIEATFTIQEVLVLSGIGLAVLLSSSIRDFYGFDRDGLMLIYALLLAFFMASLKTIPSVLLERKLKFEKVIIPQVAETLVFNVLIVSLAVMGFGIKSYVVAVVARAFVGVIAIYYLVPWRPKIRFSIKAIKSLLKFGIPYQANSILAVFKDKVSLLVLGKILGLEAMGILGWAEKWANLALRYFLDSTVKVAFPMFSRLQAKMERLQKSLEYSVYFISVMIFPVLTGAYFIMPQIVQILPKYSKWEVGLPSFNLFLVSAAIASISTFLTNFLTATGKIKQVMALMVMWTGLTLGLYPYLAIKYGYYGVAVGSVLISLTSVVTLWLVKRSVSFNLLSNIGPGLFSSLLMLVSLKTLAIFIPLNLTGLLINVIIGASVYLFSLFVVNGKQLKSYINIFLRYAKK
jgi:O-antigen/teichoic acid export membrane protein